MLRLAVWYPSFLRWRVFFFFLKKLLILYWSVADYRWYDSFRWSAKGFSHTYTCIHSPPNSHLIQATHSTEQSSMCHTVGSCWFSILNTAVWTCWFQASLLSLSPFFPPWKTYVCPLSLFLFVIVMKLRHRNDNELFQRSERFRILGLLPVFWSTTNNILYLRVIKSWHREQEGLRKLDQKIIGRTLRVSQVQATFLGQGVVQKLGLTESDLAIFSVRPNSMQRQSPCSCRT